MGGKRLPLEKVILGFLMEEPVHGYDLYQRAQDELGRIWYMGISNVYGVLKRLEEDGCVACSLEPQENRPARKVYRITPGGEADFLDWLGQPVPDMRRIRIEFVTKLYFYHALGMEGAEELIAEQVGVCRKRIEELEEALARCEAADFDRMAFDFRVRHTGATLDWLYACRDGLLPRTDAGSSPSEAEEGGA